MLLKTNKLIICITFYAILNTSFAKNNAGLVISGSDTIGRYLKRGFDFVTQQACSSGGYQRAQNCFSHIEFVFIPGGWPSPYCGFTAPNQGRSIKIGKINLDSIATAPDDSIFQKSRVNFIDSIPPDSLAQYIGNVYVIKTGDDPRPYQPAVFAKIKILDFTIRNLENHEIDMVFLWAANLSYKRDLTSENLDTFTLDYHVDTIDGSAVLSQSAGLETLHAGLRAEGFIATAVNGKIHIPAGMHGNGRELMVFDQRGRLLGRVKNTNANAHTEIRLPGGYCGVVVVR